MKESIQQLKVLHLALNIGPLLLLLIFGMFLRPFWETELSFGMNTLTLLGLVVGLVSLSLSYGVFQKKLNNLIGEEIDKELLNRLRATYILKWGLLEFAILLNLIFYFLGGNKLLLGFAALLAVLLYLSKPQIEAV